jgi:hypothetical protein
MRFDFAILKNDVLQYLIEYDGAQHFKPIKWMGGIESFTSLKKRDDIKTQYCINNNIPLIRIPYTLYNKMTINNLILPETSSD